MTRMSTITITFGLMAIFTFGTTATADQSSTSSPVDSQGQLVSTLNLYGELPVADNGITEDGLNNLNQVSFTREGADFDVDVDHTGNWMVYASTRHSITSDIYMKKVSGSTVTQITSDQSNDTMPSFSPDGKSIVFCSDRSGNWDIYTQNIDGGKPVQITNDPTHELHPSWSPDGSELIFSSLSSQSGQWEIVVVSVSNPAKRNSIGYGLFPQFSPNGNKIVYQQAKMRGTRWFSIWTVDYVNGEAIRPTEIASSINAAVITPNWSPDGNQIVFATVVNPASDQNSRPTKSDIWIVNLDGTGRTRLLGDSYVNLQPTWADDGRIYFISNRTGSDNIWSLRPESTTTTTVASRPSASNTDQAMVTTTEE